MPPQREGEGGEEEGDGDGDDDDDVEVENKRNPDEMVTDEKETSSYVARTAKTT